MEFDTILISDLLEALALAVIPVIAYTLSAYLRKQVDISILKLSEAERKSLLMVVEIAVFAAEQVLGGGFGEQKKEYAIRVVQKWLDSTGLSIDVELIEAAIEEAVYKNFPNFGDMLELDED